MIEGLDEALFARSTSSMRQKASCLRSNLSTSDSLDTSDYP